MADLFDAIINTVNKSRPIPIQDYFDDELDDLDDGLESATEAVGGKKSNVVEIDLDSEEYSDLSDEEIKLLSDSGSADEDEDDDLDEESVEDLLAGYTDQVYEEEFDEATKGLSSDDEDFIDDDFDDDDL